MPHADGLERRAPARHAGFSIGSRTWLPVAAEHLQLNAESQARDSGSLLTFYRAMLKWRRHQPLLRGGEIELLPADDAVLAFVRRDASGALLCVFNLASAEARYTLPEGATPCTLDASAPLPLATLAGSTLVLPPFGAAYGAL